MKPTFTLGRVAGVEVGINWTWLLVVALIGWSLAGTVFPEATPGLSPAEYHAMAAVAVPTFFGCLLLHELGHAVQARREGMAIEGVTLWLFGGGARFRGTFPSAGAECGSSRATSPRPPARPRRWDGRSDRFSSAAALPGALPRSAWPGVRAADRMRPNGDVVVARPDDALEEMWPRLLDSPLERALVLENDRLAGLLSATDVARILAASNAARGRARHGRGRPAGRAAA